MKHLFTSRLRACLAFLALLWPLATTAAPFTPGNLVVVRIGDGSAALTSAATATFLLEYTPSGTLVQTIALPTAVAGTNRILTNTGTSASDAILTRSVDGRYLVLTGYDAAPGTVTVTQTAATAVNRIIARIAADGTVDTSTRISDAFSGVPMSGANIRSATTVDGSNFYAVGSNSGVRYLPFGSSGTSTALNTTAPLNNRVVNIFNNNLYISAASTTFQGVSQVGTGLPTTAGQTITQLAGFPTATGPQPYAFFFADLSPSVAGVDVLYVADDRAAPTGGIQKWSLVGGTWTLNGTVSNATSTGLRGLDGMVAGTTVSLVASGTSGVYAFSDNAGYNAAPGTATLPAAVATASANAIFRGAAFAPVSGTATPAPTIASFTPASAAAGATVTVTGTNFTGATAVTLNGAAITGFTVVNATTITFTVPAGATSGTIAVTTAGGSATSTGSLTVTAPATNPVPTITSLSPSMVAAGAGMFTVIVTGTGFIPASEVVAPAPVSPTTFISATQLSVTLPPGAIPGNYPFMVVNPAPGGGTSNAVDLVVTGPMTISSLSPSSIAAGSAAFTLTVTGVNFGPQSAINFNGTVLPTTFVSATTLTATVPAALVATAASVLVSVDSGMSGGTPTSPLTFTVTGTAATPTLSSISPVRAVVGGPAFTLTLDGTNFTATTQVLFGGQTYTAATVNMTGTRITVNIPASAIATVGQIVVSATNGGMASMTRDFFVVPAATSATFEDFEQGPNRAYADAAPVMLRSGSWTFVQSLIGDQFNDRVNQVKSARIRGGGSIAMNFDKPNGAGVITLQAALYGADAPSSFILEISSNGGQTYTAVPGTPTVLTTTLTTYSYTVNRPGNIRLRISSTNTVAAANPRINIDDITITDFIGTSTREASQAQLKLYPNPTTDVVTVAVNGSAAGLPVQVRDLLGRAVLSTTLPASGQLRLGSLPAGTYLLTVDGQLTRRITKE